MLKRLLSVFLLLAFQAALAQPAAKAPVYVQLFARSTDHINLDLMENALERNLNAVRQVRERFPSADLSLLCLVSGTVSQILAERNAANHLMDRLLADSSAGIVEFGYDGSEEPTPKLYPQPNFRRAKTFEDRWRAREEAIGWFLTEYKDLLYGDAQPEKSGGLRRMQEVFGEATYITGLTQDLDPGPEAVRVLSRMNRRAVLAGLPEPKSEAARNIFGYSGGAAAFAELISPDADYSPEVFWEDGRLRLSDFSGPVTRVIPADGGPDALKAVLAALDRSRPHIIRVELGRAGIFLKPEFEKTSPSPILYAYANTKLPRLPADATKSQAEIDSAFGRELASIEWLAEEFFPANPGSRFLSAGGLMSMASRHVSRSLASDELREVTVGLLERWKIIGNHPPEFALLRGRYFSLAEMFNALAAALAGLDSQGALPSTVELTELYGPIQMTMDQGPSQGSVTVAEIARTARTMVEAWRRAGEPGGPLNVIPAWVSLGDLRLNSAQFLKLMAQAYLKPEPSARIQVTTCLMHNAPSSMLPTDRRTGETGSGWTLKPARLIRSPQPPSD